MAIMKNHITQLLNLNKFTSFRANYEYFLYYLFDLKENDRVENFTSSLNRLNESIRLNIESYFKKKIPGKPSGLIIIDFPEITIEILKEKKL